MPPRNNITRRARRKKQTRLTFEPIHNDAAVAPSSDASGPVTASRGSNFSPAKVRYTTSTDNLNMSSQTTGTPFKTKTKGLGGVSGQRKTIPVVELPPTSVKSSGVVGKVNGQNVNAPANDYDDDDSDINPFPSSRRVRNSSPPTASKQTSRQAHDRLNDTSDGSPPEDDSDDIVSKKNKKKKKSTPKKTTKTSQPILISEDDEDDEDDELQLPKLKRTPRSFIKGGNSYAAPIGPSERRSSGSRRANSSVKSRKQKSITSADEDDEDEEDELAILPKRLTRKIPPAEEALSLEDDSDEIVTTSSAKRTPRPVLVSNNDEDDDDSDEIISPLKRRRQVSEELDSDVEVSPLKRRKGAIVPEVKTPTRKTRQQRPRKRTAKEKTMELLKRKRAGEKIDKLTDSESDSEEDKGAIYDTDSDLEVLTAFDDESEVETEEVPKPSQTSKQKQKQKRQASEGEDEDDEDVNFVVDDDEGPLGVPLSAGLHEIPLEFTHHAHKPLKEHFKDAIEWMIHNKINPSFAREDPIYRAAFRKLDDEVHGYANSKYVSSAWTSDFNKALHARPHCSERELDVAALDMKCDACNRSNHPPKFAISFEGKAYSKDTLDEIEQDSDNDDSDDSENGSVNSMGQSLPADGKEWFVGRFCRSNAITAHALIHWKYALNEWVIGNLEGEGLLSPAKLAERDKMKAKQRKKLANKLVDSWDEQGIIKSLYGDFKRSLEAAREGKPESRWG